MTHSVMVRADDARAHRERAREHGARILMEPSDFSEYGERQYTAEDPAGHRRRPLLRDARGRRPRGVGRRAGRAGQLAPPEHFAHESEHLRRSRVDPGGPLDDDQLGVGQSRGEGLTGPAELRRESDAVTSSTGCPTPASASASASSHHSPFSSARIAGPFSVSTRRSSSGTCGQTPSPRISSISASPTASTPARSARSPRLGHRVDPLGSLGRELARRVALQDGERANEARVADREVHRHRAAIAAPDRQRARRPARAAARPRRRVLDTLVRS